MYRMLKDAVERRMKKGLDEAESKIASVSCGAAMKSRYFKELMTPMAMKLVKEADQDGGLPSLAIQKMMGRAARHERAWLMDSLHKIEDAEKAELPEFIYVSIDWTKSRTWGMTPHATVRACGNVTYGTASGCGYDKESAAVASAMNKNCSVLKVWYDNAERGGKFAYSVRGGIMDESLPQMDGGCGMSATKEVFRQLGYSCSENHGRAFDSYVFHKEVANG